MPPAAGGGRGRTGCLLGSVIEGIRPMIHVVEKFISAINLTTRSTGNFSRGRKRVACKSMKARGLLGRLVVGPGGRWRAIEKLGPTDLCPVAGTLAPQVRCGRRSAEHDAGDRASACRHTEFLRRARFGAAASPGHSRAARRGSNAGCRRPCAAGAVALTAMRGLIRAPGKDGAAAPRRSPARHALGRA